MPPVLEIRAYTLHAGMAEQLDRLFHEQALPLLQASGTDVVAARRSLHRPLH